MTTRRAQTRERIKQNKYRRFINLQFSHAKTRKRGQANINATDRNGNSISFRTWLWHFENPRYRIVKYTAIGKTIVSTIWEGLTHNPYGPTLIFETITRNDDGWGNPERHATEQDAIAYHDALVTSFRCLDMHADS